MARYSTRWLIEAVTDNKDTFQHMLDSLVHYGIYILKPGDGLESMTISVGDIEEEGEDKLPEYHATIQDSEERIHRRLDRIESMLTNITSYLDPR